MSDDDLTQRYERTAADVLWRAAHQIDPTEEWIGLGNRKDFDKLVEQLDQLGWRLRPNVMVLDLEIPEGFWRPVPCGHPNDPVAIWTQVRGLNAETIHVPLCHCGHALDKRTGHYIEGAPGPVVPCDNCGCATAVPPEEP